MQGHVRPRSFVPYIIKSSIESTFYIFIILFRPFIFTETIFIIEKIINQNIIINNFFGFFWKFFPYCPVINFKRISKHGFFRRNNKAKFLAQVFCFAGIYFQVINKKSPGIFYFDYSKFYFFIMTIFLVL